MQAPTKRNKILTAMFIFSIAILTIASIGITGGIAWSDSGNRLTTYVDFDGLPQITQTSDRRIWIVWQKEALDKHSIFHVTSDDDGATWSKEKNLTNYYGEFHDTHPYLIQLSNGTLLLFWSSNWAGNYDIYCKASYDLGVSWSNDTQLTQHPADDASPSVIQLSNGTLFLVWASSRTGNNDLHYKTYNGSSWSNAVQLTTHTNVDKTPSTAQTADGRIWITWSSMRTGSFEIFYKVYNGTHWTTPTQLTDNAYINFSPAILQSIGTTIYIFWSSSPATPSGTDDIYYKYSIDNGETWSPSVQFTDDQNEDSWPSATQTSDTRIWVVWTSNRGDQPDGNFDIWYRASLVGDINEDGVVNIIDLATVARAYGTSPGDPNWNPDADINKDNLVDIDDLILVSKNYGST